MATISRLSVDLIANSAKFRKDLDKAGAHSGRVFNKMKKDSERAGKAIAAMGVATAAAFTATSMRALGNFNEALADVRAKTNASRKEIDSLAMSMRTAAKATKFTATQTAEAGTFLAQAGLNVREINDALRPTLDLAAATKTSVQNTADFMTNIMKGMGMTTDELGRAADVLAVTTANSNTNLTDLATAMGYAAPSARAMGMSIEETSSLIGMMANAGIKGSTAGTALRQSFVQLANQGNVTEAALGAATGTMTRQQKALQKLGVHTMDTEGNMRNLVDILTDLKSAGADEIDMVKIFGARAGSSMMQFMNEGLEGAAELQEKLAGAADAAERMAAIQLDSLNGDVLLMKSQFEELQMIFSQQGLQQFARNSVQSLTDFMRKSEPIFKFIGNSLDELAVFFIPAAILAVGLLTKSFIGLGVAMLMNPIGATIAALGLLSVAVYKIVQNFDFVKTSIINFFTVDIPKAFTQMLISLNEWKLTFFSVLNDVLSGVADKVNTLLELYNAIPFLDDKNPVSFNIDTTGVTNDINALKQRLLDLEATRKQVMGDTDSDTDSPTGALTDATTDNPLVMSEDTMSLIKAQWEELANYQQGFYSKTTEMAEGSWSSLLDEGAKGSKKLLMLKRAFALKSIAMSTAEGMMKAMALGFPAAIPAGLKVMASAAMQTQSVKGQFHDGIDNVPNSGTYLLEQGERVVDNRLNKDLSNYLANQNNQSINTTNNPTLNFNVNGGDADGVETMLLQHRGKFESMIRDIYNENAQNSPF